MYEIDSARHMPAKRAECSRHPPLSPCDRGGRKFNWKFVASRFIRFHIYCLRSPSLSLLFPLSLVNRIKTEVVHEGGGGSTEINWFRHSRAGELGLAEVQFFNWCNNLRRSRWRSVGAWKDMLVIESLETWRTADKVGLSIGSESWLSTSKSMRELLLSPAGSFTRNVKPQTISWTRWLARAV